MPLPPPSPPARPHALLRPLTQLRRTMLRRRRGLAAVCAALAALAALRAVAAPPAETVAVLTAARDLPSGTVIAASDVTTRRFLPGSVPSGTELRADALGRTTAAPLRQGAPVTDVALVQASLLDGYPGAVAVPVRLGDAAAAALLRVGDRIALVAAGQDGAPHEVIARDVAVLALPRIRSDATSNGALIVVATTQEVAIRLAESAMSSFISPLITR